MNSVASFKNLKYAYDYFGSVPPPFESLIGYHPTAQLGEGAYGASILYENNKNTKKVVKIITPRGKSSYDREVIILKALGNKGRCTKNNISCFGEIIKFPELYFYSMDYIPGKSLWDHLNYMRIPQSKLSGIDWGNYLLTMKKMFLSLCKSLKYVHSMGVIHNDIKGNNIIVKNIKGVGTPILIDFGLSETRGDDGRVAIYKQKSPWHPIQAEYYSGFFSDATLLDFYGLKKTFFLPEIPSVNMLQDIPGNYSNDEIYELTSAKEIMTKADWEAFFVLVYRLSKRYEKAPGVKLTKTKNSTQIDTKSINSILKPRRSTLGKK